MRLAAVTLRYAWQPAEAVRLAAESSRTTHGARGSYKGKEAGDIRASGYVVHTLEAALWVFHWSADFREGALLAVNLGEDADPRARCTANSPAPTTARTPSRGTGARASRATTTSSASQRRCSRTPADRDETLA